MDTSVGDASRAGVREGEPTSEDLTRRSYRLPRARTGNSLGEDPAVSKSSRPSNRKRELLCLAFFLTAGLLVLSPVIGHPGWPANHETGSLFARTEIYAEHLRHGDLLPIWSSSDAYGMGTPLPAFYHKLFCYISSVLVISGWSVKAAVIASLLGLMVVGLYGMRFALERAGVPTKIATLGSVLLILSTYSFTDWLVRGAVAEFSAMMVVPWLLWWCVGLVNDGRFSFSIIPVFCLLYLAHNVIAFYALIVLILALAIAMICWNHRAVLLKRASVAGLGTAVLLSPLLLLDRIFSQEFDLRQIIPERMRPRNQVHAASDYFTGHGFRWFQSVSDYSVTIDSALLGSLVLLILIRAARLLREENDGVRANAVPSREECFLGAVFLVFLCMQFRPYLFVYDLPYFAFIQFPWRLLTFIIPTLIILVLVAATRSVPHRLVAAGCVLTAVTMLYSSPLLVHNSIPTLSPEDYTKSKLEASGRPQFGGELRPTDEYLPIVETKGGPLSGYDTENLYQNMDRTNSKLQVLAGRCDLRRTDLAFEASEVHIASSCDGAATVALPVSYNSLSTVYFRGRPLEYHKLPGDPRMIVDLPGDGSGNIVIELPTAVRMITHMFR